MHIDGLGALCVRYRVVRQRCRSGWVPAGCLLGFDPLCTLTGNQRDHWLWGADTQADVGAELPLSGTGVQPPCCAFEGRLRAGRVDQNSEAARPFSKIFWADTATDLDGFSQRLQGVLAETIQRRHTQVHGPGSSTNGLAEGKGLVAKLL